MKPRSYWTGFIKISLVTIPVRVYTAISEADKISFNQLHKKCHQRIRQKIVCPLHGEVAREELEKGYEYATDKFIVVDDTDLEKVRLETTNTIDLVQFVAPEELDARFLDVPYYVGPDGPVAEEGFMVLREALCRAKRIGIGRVVLTGKEKLVVLQPFERGLIFFTLRYMAEVRPAAPYFEDLPVQAVDENQIALAQHLIANKSAPLNLATFSDRYQTALISMIKDKIAGTKPIVVPRGEAGAVMGLMDALRKSVAQTGKNPAPDRRNGHKKIALAA